MRKHSSKKLDMNSLLRSRNVLYVVFGLAMVNLFGYLMLHQLDAVAFFIIIGLITTYFSKNMIIVMLTSILSTFLLVQINMLGGNKEGIDETTTPDETTATSDETTTTPTAAPTTASTTAPTAAAKKNTGKKQAAPTPLMPAPQEKSAEQKAEKFTQQLNPARYNSADDDDVPRHKPKVDYASTLESAYDNLDKLLSSDAIKNMSEDTNRLAEKQQKLMGNIEKLTPIMDKASSVLQSIDVGGITGLMGGIQQRMKGFSKNKDEDEAAPTEVEGFEPMNEGMRMRNISPRMMYDFMPRSTQRSFDRMVNPTKPIYAPYRPSPAEEFAKSIFGIRR